MDRPAILIAYTFSNDAYDHQFAKHTQERATYILQHTTRKQTFALTNARHGWKRKRPCTDPAWATTFPFLVSDAHQIIAPAPGLTAGPDGDGDPILSIEEGFMLNGGDRGFVYADRPGFPVSLFVECV